MARAVRLELESGTVVCERCLVADNPWSRLRGLLGRSELPAGEGILLRPCSSVHMMFMRFPIDVVFVGRPVTDGRRKVLATRVALPAWRGLVPLVRGAHGCLELPVGTIERTGTQVGDLIALEPAGAE